LQQDGYYAMAYFIDEISVAGVTTHDKCPWSLQQLQQSQRQDGYVSQLPAEWKDQVQKRLQIIHIHDTKYHLTINKP